MNDEYVVDASALIEAVTNKRAVGIAVRAVVEQATCHAPHLIDAEVGQVLRRKERRGEIADEEAITGLRAVTTLVEHRYGQNGWLATRAWELRNTVTFYDALYVALAARLDLPLLTGDAKLCAAPNLPCKVQLLTA
ncbi:ribonuclease VapC [Longimycelium tulufanense]|uniref:Ribonuclease VapC n=1 Tax=Longimycelium tulufanense TaxID=907463 RepID=A0A8J3CBZ8_9PSEU|nr:type II toxin-antitoxin system VapC family toxin [Longimycelium tulufanense]GGM43930.1 ribonuclease VapC [Longimycelium tulufanense]